MERMRKNSRMLKCCLAVLTAVAALICVSAFSGRIFHALGGVIADAASLTDESFSKLRWKLEFADSKTGSVQSVCVTEHYIITIDNVADDASKHDIVSAYYKGTEDENGNPVKQYSLAKRVSDFNWEHGNCMTYNPNKGLIYVALYTNTEGDNAGCIYEMNPNTLEYAGKIQIGDGSYNILGIGYKEDTNQYVIQTDEAGGYSMKLLDANFQIIDDYGPVDPSPGWNFQGLVVIGDYVINLPLTKQKLGEWIDVFSLSRRSLIYSKRMRIDLTEAGGTEGEGFGRLDEDTLILIMNSRNSDGADMVRFYTAKIPENKDNSKETVSGNGASVSENGSESTVSSDNTPKKKNAGKKPLNSLNENAVYKKDGSYEPVAEAPAFQAITKALGSAGTFLRALFTGNKKALGEFKENVSHGFRTFVQKVRHFHPPRWLPYVVIAISLFLLGPGMLLYMIHLKRARKRSRERTKRLREEIRKRMEEEE